MYIYIYIYIIYTYTHRGRSSKRRPTNYVRYFRSNIPGSLPAAWKASPLERSVTPNLPTNVVDFGGFDSSVILI